MASWNLPSEVRDRLERLVAVRDRTPPTVFAGRGPEFDLFNSAIRGVEWGALGGTVVIQGVPGAGKTALLHECAARLSSEVASPSDRPQVVPVALRPGDLDASPLAIVEGIDKQYTDLQAADKRKARVNRTIGAALLAGDALFAFATRRSFGEFRSSARAPKSLPIALNDYLAFRFDRRDSIIVLLVDEAQNLADTPQVREHLDALHGGINGNAKVLLACFGLANTVDRLRHLGLSRLASGHARTIGQLTSKEAAHTVKGTLDAAFKSVNEPARRQWIESAAEAILAESANFPHHLATGCIALAEIVLDEGMHAMPPLERLRDQCRRHKRDYYDARLRPWAEHTTALAHAFPGNRKGWTRVEDALFVLSTSDDAGRPVDEEAAGILFNDLCLNGHVDRLKTDCRPALPSLASHFDEIRRHADPESKAVAAIRSALSACLN